MSLSKISRTKKDGFFTIVKIILSLILKRKRYQSISIRVGADIVLFGIVTERGFLEITKESDSIDA